MPGRQAHGGEGKAEQEMGHPGQPKHVLIYESYDKSSLEGLLSH